MLFKHRDISSLMIVSFIPITHMFDEAVFFAEKFDASFKFIQKFKNLANKRDWPAGSES